MSKENPSRETPSEDSNHQENSPFGVFPKPSEDSPAREITLPRPIKPEKQKDKPPKSDGGVEYRARLAERDKSKERIASARLALRIDKDVLDHIKIPEATIPMYGLSEEEHERVKESRQKELKGLIERIKSLPEHLGFQPGITLIVGENGHGKTTLAKSIFFVLQAQQNIENAADYSGDVNTRPDEKYLQDVLHPKLSCDEKAFVIHSGLAREIAPAIKLDHYEQGQDTQQPYFDVPEIIGSDRQRDRDIMNDPRISDSIVEMQKNDYHSHRQTVDWTLQDLTPLGRGRRDKNKSRPGIFFIDEPETGLSPRRHRVIEQELATKTPQGSILLIPTNSVVLYESDLPRIDMELPERGIFRPSEYPEDNN